MLTRKDKKAARERNQLWRENQKRLKSAHTWTNGDREQEEQFFASEYGPKIQRFLWKKLQEAIEKHSDMYEDNFRHARKNDPVSMNRYDYHQSEGCCGSWDEEVVAPDGLIYLIGFNHGH